MLVPTPDPADAVTGHRPVRRVLVVDDHDAMRRALADLIDAQGDLAVCAATATAEEAIDLLDGCRPDAAVIDVSPPGMSGIELTRRIHRLLPRGPVLVISSHPATRYERPALEAGAHAYLAKREAAGNLVAMLRRSMDDGPPR